FRMYIIFYFFFAFSTFVLWSCRKVLKTWAVLAWRAYPVLAPLPGPRSLPLLGCALEIKWDSVDFSFQLEEWGRQWLLNDATGVGLIRAWIGPVPLCFVLRARHVKVVLESNTLITKPSQYDIVSDWIGTGLLTSTNEKWFGRRKMITPTFHFNILKGYVDVFVRQGQIFVDQLEKHADTDREVDVFPFIKRCALDIICETAMGTSMNTQTGGNADYVDAVVRLSDMIWSYQRFPWLWLKPIWYGCGMGFEFDRLVKMTNDFTRKVIAERRRALEDEGLLGREAVETTEIEVKKQKSVFIDMLLLMQKANALSDEDIREEVDTFMFEGHDTTASGMGFTVWFLGQYPEHQKRVHAEIDEIFDGDSNREPTEADLRRLVYLERCIKEALRLMPSVPLLARVLSHDTMIEGFNLPKDMTVVLSPVVTHRDPEHWERSEDYYPDHFLPEKVAARHPYAYIPFSAGPRNCVGQKFAIAEEKTVLSWFFRRYSVESAEPFPGNRPVPEVILKPSCGFNVRIHKRTVAV
ncbi:cyp-32A1, partial [Pristionchus pacificus]